MRVLIVKTSSMGDVLHTLPALTDAMHAHPGIQFDWLVEKSFSEIPTWHPAVNRVIPMEWRKWRKNILSSLRQGVFKKLKSQLQSTQYDLVIDAQGLMKSALLTTLCTGKKHGLNFSSAREGLASFLYKEKHAVSPKQHAIQRTRELFAKALHYPLPNTPADYGIKTFSKPDLNFTLPDSRYAIFLHGTTWASKEWPVENWHLLARYANDHGLHILIPWGNETEKDRGEKIANELPLVQVLPKCSLKEIAYLLIKASVVVAVDTGLGHMSAALSVPTISVYGPTDPNQVGTIGQHQTHIKSACPPCKNRDCKRYCIKDITAEQVWASLQGKLYGK